MGEGLSARFVGIIIDLPRLLILLLLRWLSCSLLIWPPLLLEAIETLFSMLLCPKLLGGRAGGTVVLLSSKEFGALLSGISWKTAVSSFVTALCFSSTVESPLTVVAIKSSRLRLSLVSAPLAEPTSRSERKLSESISVSGSAM